LVHGCGLLVDPMNVVEIRKAIKNLTSDESTLRRMSLEARRRATADFSWESEGIRLVKFCSRLIAPSPADLSTSLRKPGRQTSSF